MDPTRFHRLPAVPVYLVVTAVGSATFMMYAFISSVYRIVEAGLSPLELILVGTILEVSAFLFEVPTGVVADVYSRRLSIVLGSLLTGAGFIFEGLFPVFGIILAAQVLSGVGFTFRSRALQAWIADELNNEQIGRVLLRGSQAVQIGVIIGIAVGVFVGSGYFEPPIPDLAVPLVLDGCINILLALFMAMAMPEEGFRPPAREERGERVLGNHGENFPTGCTPRSGPARAHRHLRHPAVLRRIQRALRPLLGSAHTGGRALRAPRPGHAEPDCLVGHVERRDNATPHRFGRGPAPHRRHRRPPRRDQGAFRDQRAGDRKHSLVRLRGELRRGLGGPALTVWTNQQLESSVRATVFSMQSQMDALGQVATGPAMGILATSTTVRVALVAAAMLLAPPQAIFARVTRLRKADETAT